MNMHVYSTCPHNKDIMFTNRGGECIAIGIHM